MAAFFFVYTDIYIKKEQHRVALTYECNEQSTAELQKLPVFHTTVTYATAKLHILFEMDNQNTENNVNKHIFSSSEVIDKVLNAIGLTRDALSTYQQYQYPNGDYLRLRVSNHGIFLQHWFDKNREARMDGQNVPKLDVGLNLAITFAPNEQECLAMGKPFPMKIKNVTAAKTQQGNNVKPQFKVRHICYYSWMLTQEDVDAISASLSNCVTNGEDYKEPLQGNPDKVVEWEDTSNLPPKKVEGNTLQQSKDNNKLNTEQYMNKKQIRLTESDLKQIVKESVNKILSEAYGTAQKLDKGLNDRIDSYLQYDHTYDPKKDIVWDDRKLYGNNGISYNTTDNKNSSKPSVSNRTYSIDGNDIVPELDALYKAKQGISTNIYNACTKVGCKPDMFDGIMNSISEKINFVMSTLRKHSFISRGQNPYYGNMYNK